MFYKKAVTTHQTLIFIHIPKTAGSSLRKIIRKNYRPRELFLVYSRHPDFESRSELQNFTTEDFKKYKIIMGHFFFDKQLFPFQDRRFVTLLRDPVQRAISYYHHKMNSDEWRGREISLAEYLETSDDARIQFQNHQTRLLAGAAGETVTARHLEQAKRNIENHFLYVGLTERFSDTIEYLHSQLGWRSKKPVSSNVAPKKWPAGPCTEEDMEKLRELNRHDMELYDWVGRRLESDHPEKQENPA